MTRTTFFRFLHVPIDAKGDALAERIAAHNAGEKYTACESEGREAPAWQLRGFRAFVIQIPHGSACRLPITDHAVRNTQYG